MKYVCILFVLLWTGTAVAQNPKFDKLEMLYAQRHYKRVYRRSNRLLDKPEYDFSQLPKYYKSISILQLCQNRHWMLNRENALQDAKQLFLEVKASEDGEKILNAHMYELSWLKNDMVIWAADLKRMGHQDSFEEAQEVINVIFEGVPVPAVDAGNLSNRTEVKPEESVVSTGNLTFRDEVVLTAEQQIGTPYVWSGNTPEGFDCSGFTSFVMKENGKSLPRRASDQYNESKKVKQKNAQRGDLVFFDNGSGIAHVGIVISKPGEPLVMIHASSSKGVIITEVEKSEYWMKRLYGFGTFAN